MEARRFGRYEVRELVGRGTYGSVYAGYDAELERAVAIKVPHASAGDSAEQDAAFLAEARQLARLQHPGVVVVFDAGIEGEHRYIVSSMLEGESLAERLKRDRPDAREAASIAAAVADALAHAHGHGIVHRDVKPSNVILTPSGPVLVDFGLAFRQAEAGTLKANAPMGTPAYMPPEQVAGKAHAIGARADVYSLGVVLYRMLCGALPFVARDSEKLFEQILGLEPDPPSTIDPHVPAELEAICLRAMAKNRAERYDAAADMAAELRAWLAGAPVPARASAAPDAAPVDPSRTDAEPSLGPDIEATGERSLWAAIAGARAAYEESDHGAAIGRFEAAIALVGRIPAAAERVAVERDLHLDLAVARALVLGPGAAETERAVRRALELARECGDTAADAASMARASLLEHGCLHARAAHDEALERVRARLAAARESEDAEALCEAHRAAGATLTAVGDWAAGRSHLEHALDHYEGAGDSAPALGFDPGVASLAALGVVLFGLGHLDRARERTHEALTLAVDLGHPPSEACALAHAAQHLVERRDWDEAAQVAERLRALAEAHALAPFRAWAGVLGGRARSARGEADAGLVAIEEGVNALAHAGMESERPLALLLLAEASLDAGTPERGLDAAEQALAARHPRGMQWEADLYRVRAALALAADPGAEPDAEDALRRAAEIARFQTARTLELRASAALAELLAADGREAEARELVCDLFAWFDEGRDAPELAAVPRLIARLGGPR